VVMGGKKRGAGGSFFFLSNRGGEVHIVCGPVIRPGGRGDGRGGVLREGSDGSCLHVLHRYVLDA